MGTEMAKEKSLLRTLNGQVVWKLICQIITGSGRNAVTHELSVMLEYGILAEIPGLWHQDMHTGINLEMASRVQCAQVEWAAAGYVHPVATISAMLNWDRESVKKAAA